MLTVIEVSVLHIDHTGQVMYNANGSLKYIEIGMFISVYKLYMCKM